jgi:minor extracellular serine protease Vpr
VPWELAGQTSVQMKVNIDQTSGTVVAVPVAAYSPNFFLDGAGNAAALDENNALVGPSNPAVRGHVIAVYANGLGPVTNQPASGDPAPSSSLAATTAVPTVTVGGVAATVQFSGLAPGYAGLYQLNVVVPPTAPTGAQPMVMNVNGVASNTATVNIQ